MGWFSKLGGAVLGTVGGLFANRQQKKQFDANYELANAQLYNQHQIEVDDLRKAGLNPILSANAGNSTFGAVSGGSYENIGSSANSGYMMAQQAKNLEVQNDAIKAQIEKTRAEASNVLQDTKLKSAQTSQVEGETTLIPLRAENMSALTAQAKQQTEVFKMSVKVAEANIQKVLQDIKNSIRITDAQVSELGTRSQANLASASASSAVAARNYGELSRLNKLTPYEIKKLASDTAENMASVGNLNANAKRTLEDSLRIKLANEQEQSVQDIKTGKTHRFGTSMGELLRWMPFSSLK
jgi:hypothetical protein